MTSARRLLCLLPLAAGTLAQGTTTFDPDVSDDGSIYTSEQCQVWLSSIAAQDADGSGGLSEEEFYSFLSGVDDPPYVKQYFAQFDGFDDLPWVFRVVHKSLSCHCEQLGKGENCCVDDAEISTDGFSPAESSSLESGGGEPGKGPGKGPGSPTSVTLRSDQDEYRDLVCQQIAFVIAKSVPTPEPTTSPSGSPTPPPSISPVTAAPNASPSGMPSASPITDSPTGVPSRSPTAELAVFECADAGVCTDERPGEGDGWTRLDEVCTANDCPDVYDEDASYAAGDTVAIPPDDVSDRVSRSIAPPVPDEEEAGLGAGAVAGVVLAVLALVAGMAALVIYRRRIDEQRRLKEFAAEPVPDEEMAPPSPPAVVEPEPEPEPQPVPEPEPEPEPSDDESSAPSVWSESQVDEAELSLVENEDDVRLGAGSALAAVAAASTVATSLMAGGPERDEGHGVV